MFTRDKETSIIHQTDVPEKKIKSFLTAFLYANLSPPLVL